MRTRLKYTLMVETEIKLQNMAYMCVTANVLKFHTQNPILSGCYVLQHRGGPVTWAYFYCLLLPTGPKQPTKMPVVFCAFEYTAERLHYATGQESGLWSLPSLPGPLLLPLQCRSCALQLVLGQANVANDAANLLDEPGFGDCLVGRVQESGLEWLIPPGLTVMEDCCDRTEPVHPSTMSEPAPN